MLQERLPCEWSLCYREGCLVCSHCAGLVGARKWIGHMENKSKIAGYMGKKSKNVGHMEKESENVRHMEKGA